MPKEIPEIIEDPRVVIEAIRAQVLALGANDSENDALTKIALRLEKGLYKNPQDAIAAARKILENKQDYH